MPRSASKTPSEHISRPPWRTPDYRILRPFPRRKPYREDLARAKNSLTVSSKFSPINRLKDNHLITSLLLVT